MSLAKALRSERDNDTRPWLRMAEDMIAKRDPDAIFRAKQLLLGEMADTVKADLGPAFSAHWTEENEQWLAEILRGALDLFQVLHPQDVRYFIDMVPLKERQFAGQYIEDAGGKVEENAGEWEGAELEVSVFPVLYKQEKTAGSGEIVNTVIAKAKVGIRRQVGEEK